LQSRAPSQWDVFCDGEDLLSEKGSQKAALKSWVFPSPVVTPVLSSFNTDAHWAPFKLSREFEFTLLGGNDHINRIHLVSVGLNPSPTPAPAQVPLWNIHAHISSAQITGPFIYN